jgi:uncharacterized Ntn-hydrolase superfamily protein
MGLPRHPLHTYSIVAHDRTTGEMGIAVQSHWFAAGTGVIWAEPGVGVVAVQSDADPWYGGGLERLRAGDSASAALAAMLAKGPRPETHQLALVDRWGGVVAHTGGDCLAEAGHIVGPDFSVQANMMLNDTVWPAMAEAFTRATGPLAERMLAALDAAEACGGDLRGRQAAAIMVVRPEATGNRRRDRPVDLRVEDHPEPLDELRRLLTIRRAVDRADRAFDLMSAGDYPAAAAEFGEAVRIAPGMLEFKAWQGWALLKSGDVAAATGCVRGVLALEREWAVLYRRLAQADGTALDPAIAALIAAS